MLSLPKSPHSREVQDIHGRPVLTLRTRCPCTTGPIFDYPRRQRSVALVAHLCATIHRASRCPFPRRIVPAREAVLATYGIGHLQPSRRSMSIHDPGRNARCVSCSSSQAHKTWKQTLRRAVFSSTNTHFPDATPISIFANCRKRGP